MKERARERERERHTHTLSKKRGRKHIESSAEKNERCR